MEFIGYMSSILIGITLGLIGSGGSILAVPVLVYLFNVDAILATSYSLFIVGFTSAVGSVAYFRKGLVNIKTAIIFGTPSVISIFLTRAYVVPAVPNEVFTVGDFIVTKSIFLLLLFAILMIAASYSMIKKNKLKKEETNDSQKINYLVILIEGLVVGFIAGIVGAGGGFLIIPALVILSKLPIKEAIGTSLVIVTANSLIGFFGEGGHVIIDWTLLAAVSSFAMIGVFIGMFLSKKIDGTKLKPIFGWFILLIGIYIIIKETLLK
jgi:uncharacterized membrane protein YfcA